MCTCVWRTQSISRSSKGRGDKEEALGPERVEADLSQSLSRKPQYVIQRKPDRSTTPCCHDTFTVERKETRNANSKGEVTIFFCFSSLHSPPFSITCVHTHTLVHMCVRARTQIDFNFILLTYFHYYEWEGRAGSLNKKMLRQLLGVPSVPSYQGWDGHSIFSSKAASWNGNRISNLRKTEEKEMGETLNMGGLTMRLGGREKKKGRGMCECVFLCMHVCICKVGIFAKNN